MKRKNDAKRSDDVRHTSDASRNNYARRNNDARRRSALQQLATVVSIIVGVGGLALGIWQARMTQKMLAERKPNA